MVTKDEIVKALDAFNKNEFDGAIIIVKGSKHTLTWLNCSVSDSLEMLVEAAQHCPEFAQILLAVPFVMKAALSKKKKENPESAIPTQSNPEKA